MKGLGVGVAGLLLLASALGVANGQEPTPAAPQTLDRVFTLSIAPQSLSTAIIDLSRQTQVQIVFQGERLDRVFTEGLQGEMTLGAALDRLLRGTQATYRLSGSDVVTIDAPAVAESVPTVPVEAQKQMPIDAPTGATELDTIEVTASKRLKSQRDIPGSVNALRGRDLEKIMAQGMSDYLKQIPGVSLPDNEADNKVPVIRGIATQTETGFTQVPAGIYADDMPFTDVGLPIIIPDMNPFDLERVEVLKGPQGTLYGSGALAGLIRYVLQKPKHAVWETKLLATSWSTKFSESLGQTYGVALNAPLFGDAVAVRVAGVQRRDPGLYDERVPSGNDTNKQHETTDFDKTDQTSWRGLVSWQATDELKVSGFYFQQDTSVADGGAADNPDEPTRDPIVFDSPRDTFFSGTNLSAVYDFDFGTLLLSSNRVVKYGLTILRDGAEGTGAPEDPNNPPSGDPTNPDDTTGAGTEDTNAQVLPSTFEPDVEGFTHELRLSSPEGGDGDWTWLVGGLYQTYHQLFTQVNMASPTGSNPSEAEQIPPIGTPLGGIQGSRNLNYVWITLDLDAYERAVFGEATYALGDHWEFTAGARQFEQGLIGATDLYGAGAIILAQELENKASHEYIEKGLTPRFSIRYKHDSNLQAYILASRGYQFGGVQLNPPIRGLETITTLSGGAFSNYKSSKLWNYELGLRTEWLDRCLRFDTTLFYLDWQDLQLTNFVQASPDDRASIGTNVVANVGGAHSEGAEVAFEAVPFSGAKVTTSAAWISAATDVDYDSPDGNIYPAGTRLPGSQRFQWATALALDRPLPYFTSLEYGLGLRYTFGTRYFDDLEANSPSGGYALVDAVFSLRKPDAPSWVPELTVNGRNLTDVRGISGGNQDFRRKVYRFVQPRTFLLTLGWEI